MAASRREFLALAAAQGLVAAEAPRPQLEHIKIRVVSSSASAVFYHSLFGGELRMVRNSTLASQTRVEELYVKLGAADFPYLMFAQLREGESPGLDHIAILGNTIEAREAAARAGASVVDPNGPGFRVKDVDGTLIEVLDQPTWPYSALAVRLPLPSNLKGVRPAFEPIGMKSVSLGTSDATKAASFYRTIFGGAPRLQFRPGASRLARIEIAIRPGDARKTLDGRGIRAYGSRDEVLFRDLDGNEIALFSE
jgi:hypothetical protein